MHIMYMFVYQFFIAMLLMFNQHSYKVGQR